MKDGELSNLAVTRVHPWAAMNALVVLRCGATPLALGIECALALDERLTVARSGDYQEDRSLLQDEEPTIVVFDERTSRDTICHLSSMGRPPALLAVIEKTSLLMTSLLHGIGADFVSAKCTPEELRDAVVLAVLAHEQLTVREFEVYRQLRAGRSLREIAAGLNISIQTARTHARNVYRKLAVRGRAELAVGRSVEA